MTALLESPVGTLDVSRLEERQPDVPLTCTRGGWNDEDVPDPCPRLARWEALHSCGHIFRRCEEHHLEDVNVAALPGEFDGISEGQCCLCAICEGPVFIQSYVRISA